VEAGPEFGDGTGAVVLRASEGAIEEFLPAQRSLRDKRGDWGEAAGEAIKANRNSKSKSPPLHNP